MASTFGALEIFGVVFMLVILCSLLEKKKEKKQSEKVFFMLVVTVMASMLCDGVSWLSEKKAPDWFLYSTTFLSLIASGIIATMFAYYVVAVYKETEKLSWWFAHAVAIINAVGFISTLIFTVNGKLFTYVDGVMVNGELYIFVGASALVSNVFILVFVIAFSKGLEIRKLLAMVIFVAFPTVVYGLEYLLYGCTCTLVGTAIAVMVVYVMIQSEASLEERVLTQVMEKMANTDPLTGVYNRRVFEEKISGIEDSSKAGVIFCDLNGLKKVNDTYGHKAGDEMIFNFISLLKEHFDEKEFFRISGDEFVIVLENHEAEEFGEKLSRLDRSMAIHGNMASLGSAFGKRGFAMQLVEEAEKNMYISKARYYETNGQR